jgi:hypothetical protein
MGVGNRTPISRANYWAATSRADARPHLMPVWGVWLRDCFYFSTGPRSRKARNLSQNARCSVSTEDEHYGWTHDVNGPGIARELLFSHNQVPWVKIVP